VVATKNCERFWESGATAGGIASKQLRDVWENDSNKKDKPNITRCHQQGTDVVALRNRKTFARNLAED